jgi:ribulose-5-phosphate 4-epimerase/fuculose-1-phosphate aldolase
MTSTRETPQALLATANAILAREGVLDAFGHVSIRNPTNPSTMYLARSLAPELVIESDILEFDLSAEPVGPCDVPLYSERVIHAAIYRMRPDVNAICHHHAPPILPFCLSSLTLRVVTQLGATIGSKVPMWDQRDDFGATNHLVTEPQQAMSLARSLGPYSMVLMKRHGATVVASNLRELTFRAIYSCRDAELQLRALQYGSIDTFSNEEIDLAGRFPEATIARAWNLWRTRLRS